MNVLCQPTVALSSWLVIAASTIAGEPALRFCVCDNALPRAGRTRDGQLTGVDVAVAKLLAEKLDRDCEFHVCASDSCRLQNLRTGTCDAVIGLTHNSIEASEIAWTRPFTSGKFGLLVGKDKVTARTLTELRKKRVGIVAGSVPLSSQEYTVVIFPSREALLRGFESAKLDGALVDVDYAGWYLRQHSSLPLRLVDEYVSPYRWSIGIAVRAQDVTLRDALSRAIDRCIRSAKYSGLFADFGLTYRPPLLTPAAQPAAQETDSWSRIAAEHKLVISMDPANLPYSSADPQRPGFDVEIAQALAKELELELEIQWIDVHHETAMGQLLEHECDLAMGTAVDPQAMNDDEELAGKVIYSQPYYGTGYLLVARDGADKVTTLTDLLGERSRRLGTQAGTVADYSLRQMGYWRRLFGTQLATLTALDHGDIDYAYLWSNIGWMLYQSPDVKASLIPGYIPEERWNIAIAMRARDAQLQARVDKALQRVIDDGAVTGALGRYHVPYYPPFDTPMSAPEVVANRSRVDRGLEPDMSRRQTSRRTYDDLDRIRSRGTLVVGLDQNNLPFSTAHPKPAGLDYEIGQMLADELGVSLEIYWAYSSHDSYPAKLAHKRLCDVILGVIHDDRFADQVAFTEPYYQAEYLYALPAWGANENNGGPVAVEPGIAVQGLRGRNLNPYPNLEAVLSAVVTGDAPLGYVISSRAMWLAEQRWPGKLRFVPARKSVDRFGVCAAVRRNENDLQSALNEAFRTLRETGRLQQVLAKWHVSQLK